MPRSSLYCDGAPVNGLDPDGRCVEDMNNATTNIDYTWDKALHETDRHIREHILAGIPVSILRGDAFTQYKTPEDRMNQYGFMPIAFTANGVFASEDTAFEMRSSVAQGFGLNKDNVYQIQNPSYGALDLIRAGGQQAGAIDITALRAADMINASGGGTFVAHSNGSALFYAASALLRPEVKANISYQGYGPQINVNNNNVPGLRSTFNERESGDFIPLIFNHGANAVWDRTILSSGFHPLDSHDFMKGYSFDVHPR